MAVEEGSGPPVEVFSGTVLAVHIDNKVTGRSFIHRELRIDSGGALTLHGAVAEDLQDGARVRLSARRSGNAIEALDGEVLAYSTRSSSAVDIRGVLAVAHADDFANGHSRYAYEMHDDLGGVTKLNIASLPGEIHGGARVQVSGQLSADGVWLDPQTFTIEADAPDSSRSSSGLVAKAATSNSVLVILANFSNTAAPAYTASQAQQVMATNPDSVANYYAETSYGGQLMNVTVTSSWVNMNLAGTCSYTSISSAANAAAQALNPLYTAANYNFVVYLFPSQSCGWAGLAYVGSPHQAFINGTGSFVTQVVAHEMGHNFGLWHAGSLNCGTAAIGGSCSVAEYGDPWDTMGNQRAMHFNAMQKSRLGWIPGNSVATHSAGSVNYTIAPLESAGGAVYAVKIPTTNSSRTYWLEYRQPIGFDAPLSAYPTNGVQIRVANPFEWASGSDDTEILDMTPGSGGGLGDSALLVGQQFLDSTYGVNIIVTGASPSAVTVSVSKGGGTTSTTTLASSANPSTAGASVTFTATVTGTSPTGTVSFNDSGNPLSGCSAVALAGTSNSRTAACTTSALAAGTHSLVAAYSGDASNTASSSPTLSQTVNGVGSTTGLATSVTPSTVGGSVMFTATVSGSSPTGTISFQDGSMSISGCSVAALSGSGNIRTATCTTSSLAVGSHGVSALYSGDAMNNGSSSSTLTEMVNKAATSTTLGSSGNPSIASASVTFTGSITGYSPSGTVNFTDGGVSISGCSAVAVTGSGNARTAQCSTSALNAATHSIVAAYGGDANNLASSSVVLSQVVNAGAAPTALVNPGFEAPALTSGGYQYNPSGSAAGWTFGANSGIQSNGSAWGATSAPEGSQTAFIQGLGTISQAVNLSAGSYTLAFKAAQRNCCVSPYVQPVNVTVDGTQVGSLVSPAATSFASFSITFSLATSGTHTIAFAGTDPTDKTTFLDAVTLTSGSVSGTTTTLASSANPSRLNKTVTFTASVSASNPTGSVAFTANGSVIAGCDSVALSGSGNTKTAVCSTAFSSSGSHSIVATYGGDANNAQAGSAPLPQMVKKR